VKCRVYILATVRKPELLPAALLVFRTLRVAFPNSEVRVVGNNLVGEALTAVEQAAWSKGASFYNGAPAVHDHWIEGLVEGQMRPFWIVDTDVVFWRSMEDLTPDSDEVAIAGRFEPEFEEESTGTRHMERLHTAVMWCNPPALRASMRAWMAKIPAPWGLSAQFPFIRQHFVPLRNERTRFYDSTAGLWHAGIGTPFTEEQDDAFDHLHCGTYVDLIGPKLSCELQAAHQAIYADHTIAQGMRHQQAKYYERLAVQTKNKRRTA
jgi:hypothetical protein